MNIYGFIILIALLAEYLAETAADILNARASETALPDEFADVYEKREYERARKYHKKRTRFGMLSTTFHLGVLLFVWQAGGFNLLDQWIRQSVSHPVLRGLTFIGVLAAAKAVLSLPFNIYSTFVIEEEFGFNQTTAATFIADLCKGLLLSLVLGVPLVAAVLGFFEYAGPAAWLYCWSAVTAFTVFTSFVAPAWIMPLFYKFSPLEDAELKHLITTYLNSVNFPVEGVYVIDASRRSTKSNAFFAGFGKQKRIALFDTLLKQHAPDEVVAVIAHEVGHYKKKHIVQRLVLGILHSGILFLLLSFFLSEHQLYAAFYIETPSVYTGLFFFGLLYSPVEFILSIFLQALSRRHEYQADRFVAETPASAEAMVRALKKMSAHNLSLLTPHPFYVALNYSHPPLLQRIQALKRL